MGYFDTHTELIICIITASLGYVAGRRHQLFLEKRSMLRERFEKLYAPFEKMIWIHTHGAFNFSELEPSLQKMFFELLFNNYEYADSELKELLMRFKWTYDTPIADKEAADKHFFMIENRISQIFGILSKKLFLEPYCIKYANKVSKEWDRLS